MSERLQRVREFTEKQNNRDTTEADIHLASKKKEIYNINYEHFQPDQQMFSNFRSKSESSLLFEHWVIKEIKRSTKNIQKLDKINTNDDSQDDDGIFSNLMF